MRRIGHRGIVGEPMREKDDIRDNWRQKRHLTSEETSGDKRNNWRQASGERREIWRQKRHLASEVTTATEETYAARRDNWRHLATEETSSVRRRNYLSYWRYMNLTEIDRKTGAWKDRWGVEG